MTFHCVNDPNFDFHPPMTLLQPFLASIVIVAGFLSFTASFMTTPSAGTVLLISQDLCQPTDPITPTSDDDASDDASDSNSDENNEEKTRSGWSETTPKIA